MSLAHRGDVQPCGRPSRLVVPALGAGLVCVTLVCVGSVAAAPQVFTTVRPTDSRSARPTGNHSVLPGQRTTFETPFPPGSGRLALQYRADFRYEAVVVEARSSWMPCGAREVWVCA